MLKYILMRLLMMIPVVLGVVIVVFFILRMSPACPIRIALGDLATQEEVDNMRDEMGLNDPVAVQLANYLGGIILRGDFGVSYTTRRPVLDELIVRLPPTISLAVMSTLLAALIGIPFGIISAIKQYSFFDRVLTVSSLTFLAMPTFWVGLMFIIIFSLNLRWLPASGWMGPRFWVLPVLAVGTGLVAGIMRITRSSMLETIRQDYIRTARAKGQSEFVIITKHALRNAIIPTVTLIGLQFGRQLGGAFVVESVFAIPGLGQLLVDASSINNIPVVQGGVIFVAVIFSFINLAVDILYGIIDPRFSSLYKTKKRKSRKEDGGAKSE